MNRTIVWFRRDLRVFDHAPLHRAALRGAVIPVFVFDRALLHHPETGPSRVSFLLAALAALDQDLRQRGGRLILRSGDPVELLPQLVKTSGADGIYAYIDYERIYGRVRDARLNQAMAQQNLRIRWFEPTAGTGQLLPYPQYREFWHQEMTAPQLPAPTAVHVPAEVVSEPLPTLTDLGHQADGKFIPPASIQAARSLLQEFLQEKTDRYYWQLSYPGAEATTGLSPYIKFGVISIRECYQTTQVYSKTTDQRIQRSCQQFNARLRWGSGFGQRFRYLPQLEIRSLYQVFDQEGWPFDPELYQAWQEGRTGFAIVDAAARCLLATGGWRALNFRSRAIYASFLGNLLGMDWRYGALHFMRHLIDGDCPIDHYQWAMQSGVTHCVDKAWTRIYNPEQVAVDRCDPEGAFIKRWVPELAHLPPEKLGRPGGVNGYPAPILDYKTARRIRVAQLERQRQPFLQQRDVLPHVARLPPDLTPFGLHLVKGEGAWARESAPALFPAALDLEHLDAAEIAALRTWFVAHVDIQPRRSPRRRATRPPSPYIQLNLFDLPV